MHAPARAINWSRFAVLGLGTVLAAVVANTVLYFIGSALVGYDPDFFVLEDVFGPISLTLAPALGAVLLYAALLRFTYRPRRIFTIIAAAVLVVSIIPDFTYIPTQAGSTNPEIAILVAMHVVAAAVIVRMLTSSPR
jgi:uncharacterized protein DUF6069